MLAAIVTDGMLPLLTWLVQLAYSLDILDFSLASHADALQIHEL
jgi:hypothetical protein